MTVPPDRHGEVAGQPARADWAKCLVALGSNLGDRLAHLRAGLDLLSAEPAVRALAISGLYETAPVGGPDRQGPYYNAAVLAQTSLTALELLAVLHRIEAERERERVVRWGSRTLDLDLLILGHQIVSTPTLQLPHPRMHQRRFVMVPVCDVAPDMAHPVLKRTLADLCTAIPAAPGDLRLVSTNWYATNVQGHHT